MERAELQRLSERARLDLDDSEAEELRVDLQRLLTYVERLEDDPDTAPVPADGLPQDDEPRPGLTRQEIAEMAPSFNPEKGLFVCQRILDGDD